MSPKWHSDFGDPLLELEALKRFCTMLLKDNSLYSVELDCYEEGYMNVNLFLEGRGKIGELHVVDSKDYEYGLFLDDEDEDKYFVDVEDGLKFFKKIRKQ